MDQELYDAAMDVMEAIEDKLTTADRNALDEEVLGRRVAQAYHRWQSLALFKQPEAPSGVVRDDGERVDRRRYNRPATPPKPGHPWRARLRPR
jgi:hypothetical protein